MVLTNEDLLALSNLFDVKFKAELEPIKQRLARIEVDLLEHNAISRLSNVIQIPISAIKIKRIILLK